MEQKIKRLKVSSKVVAILMKIGYISMIVAMCICGSSLVFMAATGGKTSIVTTEGTKIGIASNMKLSTGEFVGMFTELFVISAFLFVIFLLAYRMFKEISVTGDPFTTKYVKTIRTIGILVVVTYFAVSFTESIVSLVAGTKSVINYAEAPGIGAGAFIFFFSFIIDYGCGLKEQKSDEE